MDDLMKFYIQYFKWMASLNLRELYGDAQKSKNIPPEHSSVGGDDHFINAPLEDIKYK